MFAASHSQENVPPQAFWGSCSLGLWLLLRVWAALACCVPVCVPVFRSFCQEWAVYEHPYISLNLHSKSLLLVMKMPFKCLF